MVLVALGYALASLVMALAGFTDTGVAGDALWGDVIGVLALVTCGAFLYAVNWSRPVVLRYAYLAVAGLYVARWAFVSLTAGVWTPAGWLSLASGVVAFGLFWHVRSEQGRGGVR